MMRRMDPLVLSRLAPGWASELVGALFAGLRPTDDGVELVFDRPPEGARPGRRSALRVRLAPPAWAWTAPIAPDARDWAHRLAGSPALLALEAAPGDRRLTLRFTDHCIHIELWPPGNVLVENAEGILTWCARTRPASSFRGALAAGEPYAPPEAPTARDPGTMSDAELAAIDPARWSRELAGLPKGLVEALALPRDASGLRAWFAASYAGEPPVRGYTWRWPSPGATLLTRALTLPSDGPKFVGSYGSWAEAAREVARALPAPVDPSRVGAAKATLRRLERAHSAVTAEIEEARGASELRDDATALAAFLPRVVRGASSASVPDPSDPSRTRTVALDPSLKPHENVDRLIKRAGKLERVAAQAPARLAELAKQIDRARLALAAAERGEPAPPRAPRASDSAVAAPPRKKQDEVPSALQPRRFRTREGWEVLIGKSNQGNDHLTHRLARSEDYWMHVHGAAGSHVVLRRGKGPNEPSKATLEEVAGWTAFYSQAKNAGTVPVTVTQKKYVSKPRKAPAGLAHVTRSKTVFARPTEPPDTARDDG